MFYFIEEYKKKSCRLTFKLHFEILGKINATSRYVNHVYTLPPKISSVLKKKKKSNRLISCVFCIHRKYFGVVWQGEGMSLSRNEAQKTLSFYEDGYKKTHEDFGLSVKDL